MKKKKRKTNQQTDKLNLSHCKDIHIDCATAKIRTKPNALLTQLEIETHEKGNRSHIANFDAKEVHTWRLNWKKNSKNKKKYKSKQQPNRRSNSHAKPKPFTLSFHIRRRSKFQRLGEKERQKRSSGRIGFSINCADKTHNEQKQYIDKKKQKSKEETK